MRDVSGHHNPRSRRRGKGREDRKPSQQAILRSLPPRGRKNWASWSWPAAAGRDGGRSRPPASVFFLFPFLIFLQGKLGTSVPTGLPYGLQIPATPRDSLVLSLECLGRGASSLGQAWDIAQCRKFSAVPEADGGGGKQPEQKEFPGLEKCRKAVQASSSPGPSAVEVGRGRGGGRART